MMPSFEPDEDLRIIAAPDQLEASVGNLAALIVERDRAYFAPGALHAKSPVEEGVRWVEDPSEVPNGTDYWIAWVTLGRRPDGERGYRGLQTSHMWINLEAKIGHKKLGEHVNGMKAALDGRIELGDDLPAAAHRALLAELKARGLPFWRNAFEGFHEAFSGRD